MLDVSIDHSAETNLQGATSHADATTGLRLGHVRVGVSQACLREYTPDALAIESGYVYAFN